MKTEAKPLSSVRIAFLYFGGLMGAGFASGREIWQFFGVFGDDGIYGIAIIAVLFILMGFLIVGVSHRLGTGDLAKILLPVEHPAAEKVVGWIVASFLFMGYFSMLAAGGALVEQQFGLHRGIGSLVLMLLVTFTAIRGFRKVSDRLGKVTPILLAAALTVSLVLLFNDPDPGVAAPAIEASPLAPNWLVAAIVFLSYNVLGAVPILGNCTIYTDRLGKARIGAVLGGLFLGSCAFIIYLATRTDPGLAADSPLPMLALAWALSPLLRDLYALVLVISVFGTATTCFFGFSTRIGGGRQRESILWAFALVGLAGSMLGFSRIVAIIYPLEGYVSLVLMLLLLVNYIRLAKGYDKW